MSGQNESPYYFVPHPSRHPISAAAGLLVMLGSLAAWINDHELAPIGVVVGLLWLLYTLWHWFGDAIAESEGGMYGKNVDKSYRWSMSWFIFSEVMFFGAFFGALFYARSITMPDLGDLDSKILWPDFVAHWGNAGPAGTIEKFTTMGPFWIPTINTALLLTSGVTLTIAHHALRAGHRTQTAIWLFATI